MKQKRKSYEAPKLLLYKADAYFMSKGAQNFGNLSLP